jgi:Ca2+-transporting ATPase
MEDAEKDVMQRPPRDRKESIFSGGLGFDIVFQGFIIAAVTVFSFFVGCRMECGHWAIADSRVGMTMAFLTLSMIEIFHSFNLRSRITSLFAMKKQNGMLWLTLAFSLLVTAAVVFIPALNRAFSFQPISFRQYLIAIAMALTVIPIVEIEKAVRRWLLNREQ